MGRVVPEGKGVGLADLVHEVPSLRQSGACAVACATDLS